MVDILQLIGIVYLVLGLAVVIAAILMILAKPSAVSIDIKGKEARGWKRGVILMLVLIVVLFLWPLVVMKSVSE